MHFHICYENCTDKIHKGWSNYFFLKEIAEKMFYGKLKIYFRSQLFLTEPGVTALSNYRIEVTYAPYSIIISSEQHHDHDDAVLFLLKWNFNNVYCAGSITMI